MKSGRETLGDGNVMVCLCVEKAFSPRCTYKCTCVPRNGVTRARLFLGYKCDRTRHNYKVLFKRGIP